MTARCKTAQRNLERIVAFVGNKLDLTAAEIRDVLKLLREGGATESIRPTRSSRLGIQPSGGERKGTNLSVLSKRKR